MFAREITGIINSDQDDINRILGVQRDSPFFNCESYDYLEYAQLQEEIALPPIQFEEENNFRGSIESQLHSQYIASFTQNLSYIQSEQKNQPKSNQYLTNKRKVNQIVCTKTTINKWKMSHRGPRFQTHNLAMRFFRITIGFLRILLRANQLSVQTIRLIASISSLKGTMLCFNKLFQIEGLRQESLFFYSSKHIVVHIFRQKKLKIKMKLVMIKYLEKIRNMIVGSAKSWK